MKSALRRSVLIGNFLNLLIGVHFVVVAIVSLIKLRWYHQITIVVRVRNSYTTTTSYLAFVVLILVGLLLVAIFIAHLINSTARIYISSSEDAIKPEADDAVNRESYGNQAAVNTSIISAQSKSQVFGWTLIHLVAAIGLVAIIAVWSLNSGELVRQTISTQLEQAYSKYQFTNRSNPYTIAIDGMQDINTCCGSFDYTDFPHQRVSGLSNGNYPGSCCGKNIFGNNARVICTPEEIVYVRQTNGCVQMMGSYYDLVMLLVVPVGLIGLIINIAMIIVVSLASNGRWTRFHINETSESHMLYRI